MTETTRTQHRLTSWNPVSHMRLLIWLFLQPEKYTAYQQQEGDEHLRRLGVWMTSTLTWLPLLLAALGAALGITPFSQFGGAGLLILILAAWYLTGRLGLRHQEDNNRIAGLLALFIAFGVAYLVVDRLATGYITVIIAIIARGVAVTAALDRSSNIATAVSLGVAISAAVLLAGSLDGGATVIIGGIGAGITAVLLHVATVRILEKALEKGEASFGSFSIFASLTLSYVFLAWIYLAGGWRVLFEVQQQLPG